MQRGGTVVSTVLSQKEGAGSIPGLGTCVEFACLLRDTC